MLQVFVPSVMFITAVLCAPVQYSDTRYDGTELKTLLGNDEQYLNLFQCVIGRGKCTPDQELLKSAIPGAILDGCAACNAKQSIGSKTFLEHLINERPSDMLLLEGEFDPDGSYRKSYEHQRTNSVDSRKRSAILEQVELLAGNLKSRLADKNKKIKK
ncbi:chemosensory protein [Nesidiocoris tenuis]|uniref:Chemosensory protein n=1 Tax=Nesidiocoris tenuis TaxID=355587 RepID=A0ABN7BAT5_9HEMI|nr:chemosensory protein [Nesidiocoris tenuis]